MIIITIYYCRKVKHLAIVRIWYDVYGVWCMVYALLYIYENEM